MTQVLRTTNTHCSTSSEKHCESIPGQFLAHVQTKTLIHVDNQGTPMIILLRKCLFGDHLCSFFCWGIGLKYPLKCISQDSSPGGQELQINIFIFHCWRAWVLCIFQSPSKIFLSRAVSQYFESWRSIDPKTRNPPKLQIFRPRFRANKFRGPKGLRICNSGFQGVYHFKPQKLPGFFHSGRCSGLKIGWNNMVIQQFKHIDMNYITYTGNLT